MPRIISASLALLPVVLSAAAEGRQGKEGPRWQTPPAEVERVAGLSPTGEPLRCLRLPDILETRPVGTTMLLVREGANRWYRMTFQEPCRWLNLNRVVSFRTTNGMICAGDLADVTDLVARIRFPACVLGPFEPIRRADVFPR